MRGMPLLQNDNWYACLKIEEIDNLLDAPVMPKNPPTPKVKCRNWEKRLP
jgi:hypothetical protein